MRRMALCLVFLATAGCGEPGGGGNVTRNQLKELKTNVELFLLETDRLPRHLGELSWRPAAPRDPYLDEVPLDPWDEEYVYEPGFDAAGEPTYRLLSKGPDRVRGTGDDVELRRR